MPHPGPLNPMMGLSTGPGPPLAPPPGTGLSVVKVEDSWAQSPPVPTSCRLSRQSPSATSSPGGPHVSSRDLMQGEACRGLAGVCFSFPVPTPQDVALPSPCLPLGMGVE